MCPVVNHPFDWRTLVRTSKIDYYNFVERRPTRLPFLVTRHSTKKGVCLFELTVHILGLLVQRKVYFPFLDLIRQLRSLDYTSFTVI